jgi:hypothetical protein
VSIDIAKRTLQGLSIGLMNQIESSQYWWTCRMTAQSVTHAHSENKEAGASLVKRA